MPGTLVSLKPDAFSGRRLGKYELICRLSTGGMSEIFLAYQKGLAGFRKLVVLKQILPDVRGQEDFVRLFLDEAKISAAFNHPNIAQVYDLDIADGELFLAMEFVHGATLIEVAKACGEARQPIPIGFTLAIARDTALALHYAHTFVDPAGNKRPVIHRDVAEKNIMVTYDGVTKLLDFGIAKQLGRQTRTTVGMIRGTSGYMSPEQVLGEPIDARSDVFSLGVVMHECLTGQRLFKGKTPRDELMAPLTTEVLPPSARVSSVTPQIDAVVLKALEKDRFRRFASALELARAIEEAAGPTLWTADRCGELVQRFFADRREQTRKLLADVNRTDEITSVSKISERLAGAEKPPDNVRTLPVRAVGPGPESSTDNQVVPTSPQRPAARSGSDGELREAFDEHEEDATEIGDPLELLEELKRQTAPPAPKKAAAPAAQRPTPQPQPHEVADEPPTLRPQQLRITPQPVLDPGAPEARPVAPYEAHLFPTEPGTSRLQDLVERERQLAPKVAPEPRPPPPLGREPATVTAKPPAIEPKTIIERPRAGAAGRVAVPVEPPAIRTHPQQEAVDDGFERLQASRRRRAFVVSLVVAVILGGAAAAASYLYWR